MGEGGLPYGIGRHPEVFVVRAAAGIIAFGAVCSLGTLAVAVVGLVVEGGATGWSLFATFGVLGAGVGALVLWSRGPQVLMTTNGITKLRWPRTTARWDAITEITSRSQMRYVGGPMVTVTGIVVRAPAAVQRRGTTRRRDKVSINTTHLEAHSDELCEFVTDQ